MVGNRPPAGRPAVRADVLRGPFDPGGQPELRRKNHVHLSLFAWNVSSGLSGTKAVLDDPGRHQHFWKWPSAVKLLQAAEAAGFDSQLQYGMWSGYEGASEWNNYSLDFATAATGSAAVTSRLEIYSTMHVGYKIPPVMFAKWAAATDHLSGGRLGVNIVAGQNAADYAQFGLVGPPSQEIRYAIADELVTAMKYLWSSEKPVDFEGEYFQMYGAQVQPRPTRRPRPLLICAAGSDIGLDFATRQCDALFITSNDNSLDGFAKRAEKIHGMAAEHERKVRICAMCYVVIEETDAQAAETVERIRQEIDRDALEVWLRRTGHIINSERQEVGESLYGDGRDNSDAVDDPFLGMGQEFYENLGVGMAAYKLFGSPQSVADQLIDLYEAGVEQVALSFFDPHKGIQMMGDHVIPLLQERGYNRDLGI